MLPWIIAIFSTLAFIALWLFTVKRELDPLWKAVQRSDKQVRLYWGLLMGVHDDPEKKAYMQEHYQECCKVYARQAKLYNGAIHRFFYAPAAWLLGFRSVPEVIDL